MSEEINKVLIPAAKKVMVRSTYKKQRKISENSLN